MVLSTSSACKHTKFSLASHVALGISGKYADR